MKIAVFALALLSGCATEPPTPFQQQMILMQMSRPAYQLPQPTLMYVPQTRIVTCTRADGTTYVCQ